MEQNDSYEPHQDEINILYSFVLRDLSFERPKILFDLEMVSYV